MSEQISIFNVGQHQEELNQSMLPQRGESSLFDPRIKNVTDVLVFVLRPMPYAKDVRKSMVSKRYYALPDAQGTIWFDSKTTFNDKATNHMEFCPVSDLWVRLRNAGDPSIQSRADSLRMQIANYAYVQIVQYPADPTLNGKIVPMRIPAEMIKLFQSMAQPSDQDIALGAKPTQPFDIMNGYDIKVTITGKMVKNQLMRDWKCEKFNPQPTQAKFPLGPNGAMVDVSQLPQDTVLAYFNDAQTENLEQQYGYHEPNVDTKVRMYNYMMGLVADIPGLPEVVQSYFPEIKEHLASSANAQPAVQTIPAAGVQASPDPIAAAMAAAQQAQPAAPAQPRVDYAPAQPLQSAQPAPGVQQPAQPIGGQPAQPAPGVQQPAQPIGGQPAQPAPGVQQPGIQQPIGAQPAQPAQPAPGVQPGGIQLP